MYTGKYEVNPEILGRKMSKLSYVASFANGLHLGYLDKVESTREAKLQSKLMIDTSSVAIDFDAGHLDSTINQQSQLNTLGNNSKLNLSVSHRKTRSKLDSIKEANYLSKLQLYDEEHSLANLFQNKTSGHKKDHLKSNSFLLPSIASKRSALLNYQES